MKFDKSKILTAVTADQARVGMRGWVADTLSVLMRRVKECHPITIAVITGESMEKRFVSDANVYALFYPAHSHIEKQAEWVKEHNIQVGTKVHIARDFGKDWEAGTTGHSGVAGMTGKVWNIGPHYVDVVYDLDKVIRTTPYYVLEVIKEPTYRPFNNDELNDLVGEVLTNKQSGRKKVVTGKPTASEGVNLDGSYINAKDLLASFYRNGDESCGVKEEV